MEQDSTECELIIRRMVASDLDSVSHVETAANSHGWKRSTFAEGLRNGSECWVIDDPLTHTYTIAHAVLGFSVDSAELYNLSVSPRYQGQKFGSVLLDHVLDIARTRPIKSVFLEVRVSNAKAIRLYTSRGFVNVGVRKDYYKHAEHGREDAYVMRLPVLTVAGCIVHETI